MDVYQHVKISYLIRFHQNENLLRFSRRRRLDDVFTTSHMRRTLARENFTSARRRRAISLSMLKVPNDNIFRKTRITVKLRKIMSRRRRVLTTLISVTHKTGGF